MTSSNHSRMRFRRIFCWFQLSISEVRYIVISFYFHNNNHFLQLQVRQIIVEFIHNKRIIEFYNNSLPVIFRGFREILVALFTVFVSRWRSA